MAVRQAGIAGAGIVLLAALWRFRMRLLMALGWVTYAAAVLLLGAVHTAGVTVNGARRWIGIGEFTFQPSELAKLGLLLVLASVLGSSRPAWQRFVLAWAKENGSGEYRPGYWDGYEYNEFLRSIGRL